MRREGPHDLPNIERRHPERLGRPEAGGEAAVDSVGVDREVDPSPADTFPNFPEDGADPAFPHRVGGVEPGPLRRDLKLLAVAAPGPDDEDVIDHIENAPRDAPVAVGRPVEFVPEIQVRVADDVDLRPDGPDRADRRGVLAAEHHRDLPVTDDIGGDVGHLTHDLLRQP